MTGKVPPEREDDLAVGDYLDELSSARVDATAENSKLTAGTGFKEASVPSTARVCQNQRGKERLLRVTP